MSEAPSEAIEALALADALLRQRDEAERAMVAAAKKGKTADVPLHLAEVESTYAGVWPALDRAAKLLTDEQRCPPSFLVHRASLDDRARARGAHPAPGSALGSTLEREGVRVAKLALAAMQEALPDVDWAARAKASPAAPVAVGRGSMRTPVLVASAIAAMAAIGFVVVMSREPKRRERPPVPEAEIDVSALVRADTHVVSAWLEENDERHPDATGRLREAVSAELRAEIISTTDDDVLARAIERATALGLDVELVETAHVRRAVLLTAALPTMSLDELAYRITGQGAYALSPTLRAQVLATYDAALVAALDKGHSVDDLLVRLGSTARSPDELPRASEALGAIVRADLARELPRAQTAVALDALRVRAMFLVPEDELRAMLVPRAAQLVAASKDIIDLGNWIQSDLLDDATIAATEARAVALAKKSAAAARTFLDHPMFEDLDATDDVVNALDGLCAAQARRARAKVIRVITERACVDGELSYATDDDLDDAEVALAALRAELERVLGAIPYELHETYIDDEDVDFTITLDSGAACTFTLAAGDPGVTGTIKGACAVDPGTP